LEWLDFFVSLLDYLANPALDKKNYLILKELASVYIPDLESRKSCFEHLTRRLDTHLQECYDLGPVLKGMLKSGDALEIQEKIKNYFTDESGSISGKRIALH